MVTRRERDPLVRVVKSPMDVTVNKILWLILLNQPMIALKSPVAGIFRIMNMPGRGMGDYQVDTSPPPELGTQPAYDGPHLGLGVLIRPAIVPMRTFQPNDFEPFEGNEPGVQV